MGEVLKKLRPPGWSAESASPLASSANGHRLDLAGLGQHGSGLVTLRRALQSAQQGKG